MTNRRIYDEQHHAQFVTFSCYKRRRMLDHVKVRDVLLELFAQTLPVHGGVCSGYVAMPEHVHAIIWFSTTNRLSRFMKSWKQKSSNRLKRVLRGVAPQYAADIPFDDPFWLPKYYPVNLYSSHVAEEKLEYMHMNPVRRGLVERAVDWKWSSARFYLAGEPSPVPLDWVF